MIHTLLKLKGASLDFHDVLNLIAGFLLGLLPIIIPALHRYIKILRTGVRTKYSGSFLLYHWGGLVTTAIRAKKLNISLSWSGKLKAHMPIDSVTNLSFDGELLISSSGIMYLNMIGIGHPEHIMIVLNAPLHSKFMITTGVFAALDMQGTPTAFKAILSRTALTDEQAVAALGYRQVIKFPRMPTSMLSDFENFGIK
jgi:hypothetical protein